MGELIVCERGDEPEDARVCMVGVETGDAIGEVAVVGLTVGTVACEEPALDDGLLPT